MPPLDDNDRKEIEGLLAKALGVPEGKSITEHQGEVVAGAVNEILNKYDKGQKKEREAFKSQLSEIAEAVKGIAAKGGKGDDDVDDDDPSPDHSKLPKGVQEALAKLEKQNKSLAQELEAERKAREEEKAEREKVQAENERQKMIDTTRSLLISKEIGVDPDAVDFALDHLEHRGLLRKSEDGKGYEIQHGTSKVTGDPEWHPLDKGLKQWVTKGPGARFLPAVKGGSPPAPAGGGGGGARTAGSLSLEDAQQLSSAELEKAIAEGRFTESSLEG